MLRAGCHSASLSIRQWRRLCLARLHRAPDNIPASHQIRWSGSTPHPGNSRTINSNHHMHCAHNDASCSHPMARVRQPILVANGSTTRRLPVQSCTKILQQELPPSTSSQERAGSNESSMTYMFGDAQFMCCIIPLQTARNYLNRSPNLTDKHTWDICQNMQAQYRSS